MKTIKAFILIIILFTVLANCNKKEQSAPQEVSGKDTATSPNGETGKNSVPQVVVDPSDLKTISVINDQKLTNGTFKAYVRSQYAGIADSKPNPRLLSRLFDSFLERKIVAYVANHADTPVDEEEINRNVSKLTANPQEDKQPPVDREAVIEDIRVQKYLYHHIYKDVDVSDKEIGKYYKDNLEDYRKKREVQLYQILVKNREDALKIRGELINHPGRFEEIAKEKSISLESKQGGFMGYFEEGTLPKDMENVVFSLNINSISPVMESSYGFHIFKITKKKSSRLLYLDIVKPEIKNKLMAEKLRTAYLQFLEQTKKELNIEVNYKNLYFEYHPVEDDQNNDKGDTNNETSNFTDRDGSDTEY